MSRPPTFSENDLQEWDQVPVVDKDGNLLRWLTYPDAEDDDITEISSLPNPPQPTRTSLLCCTYDANGTGTRHYSFHTPTAQQSYGKVYISVWPTFDKRSGTLGISCALTFPREESKADHYGWGTVENREKAFDAAELALSTLHGSKRLHALLAYVTAIHLSQGETIKFIQGLNYLTEQSGVNKFKVEDRAMELLFGCGTKDPRDWEAEVRNDLGSLIIIPTRGKWKRADKHVRLLVGLAGMVAVPSIRQPVLSRIALSAAQRCGRNRSGCWNGRG